LAPNSSWKAGGRAELGRRDALFAAGVNWQPRGEEDEDDGRALARAALHVEPLGPEVARERLLILDAKVPIFGLSGVAAGRAAFGGG